MDILNSHLEDKPRNVENIYSVIQGPRLMKMKCRYTKRHCTAKPIHPPAVMSELAGARKRRQEVIWRQDACPRRQGQTGCKKGK